MKLGHWCSIAAFLAGLAATGGALAAATADVTDLWWDPGDSGWGITLTQTGTLVFGTAFVYGPDRAPTWFVGQMNKTADELVTRFTGPLYVTTGPYYGGGFSPRPYAGREAGTMTFTLADTDTGTLRYTVDGVVVEKIVQRQPLTFDSYTGTYRAMTTSTSVGCRWPRIGVSSTGQVALTIEQNNMQMRQTWTLPDGDVCTASGTYGQLGRMGQFSARYSCAGGDIGTLSLYQMNKLPGMLTSRYRFVSTTSGCTTDGEIAGIVPR